MFPCGLAASQETPFLLIAWVSLTVRALLTQPCLVGTGSVGCGGLGQARWGGGGRAPQGVGGHDAWSREEAGSPGALEGWGLSGEGPYTAAQFAPGEFGLRVASGEADQPHFISLPPAALCLGLSLLLPYLGGPCGCGRGRE